MAEGEVSSGGARKTISPYDITSLDNPGLVITQVQLKDENYEEWARSIRAALRARKNFGFVDGTLRQTKEDSGDFEDWWTINSLLVSWIRNTIEATLRSTVSHVEVAEELWNDLKDRFSITNGPQIQQLKSTLAECKQRGLSIMGYYSRLKKLWVELGNFEQLVTCKCGNYTCNLGAILENKREEEKVHTFLMGFYDSTYGTVRSNILASEPLLNLNKVYSVLIQEERVKTITRGKDDHGKIMALAVKTHMDKKEKYKLVCTHCNQTGHEQETCFALHGYPEWWVIETKVKEGEQGEDVDNPLFEGMDVGIEEDTVQMLHKQL